MNSATPIDAWCRWSARTEVSDEGRLAPDALRCLGLLSLALGREALDAALQGALESLSSVCQASAMGLWLGADPARGVFLTACTGKDRAELFLRPRLELGQCLPGLALDNGVGVHVASLSRERRLLRRNLRRFGGYACIPFGAAEGCLEVVFDSAGLPPPEHLTLLAAAVSPIRDRVARARVEQREQLVSRLERARSQARAAGHSPDDELGRTLAVHLRELASARRVDVILAPGNAVDEPRRYRSPAGAHDALRPVAGDVVGCGKLHSGCGQCLSTARRDWPGQCRRLPATVEAPTCLPLLGPNGSLGSVVVDAGSHPPEPVTANAVQLLDACREAARFLSPRVFVELPAPSTEPRLSITCFGALEVSIDGVPVPPKAFTRRKARVLLGLLLLEGGRPVDASVLAETLWPEVSEAAGRNRLHGVVHCLRQVIEPSPETKRWLYVRNDGHLYHFNIGAPVHVDLVRFKELIAVAREHRRAKRIREAAACLTDATATYRADLLTDEPYIDRFDSERQELRRRCLEANKTLASLRGELAEVDEALAALRRASALDPYDDEVNIALLRVLAGAGRTAEARAVYDAYEDACRRELGVAPSSTIRALRMTLG